MTTTTNVTQLNTGTYPDDVQQARIAASRAEERGDTNTAEYQRSVASIRSARHAGLVVAWNPDDAA